METTEDLLLDGRVRLIQPKDGYRAAIDPVLLAASVAARAGERVVDLGCGAGAVFACIGARVPGVELIGVERDPEMAGLARRTLAVNGFDGRIETADLTALPATWEAGLIDHVSANPPYLPSERGRPSPNPGRAAAGVETGGDLADWVAVARRCLRHKGTLTLVHRADRLDDILAALVRGFGSVVVFPLFPKAGRDAGRVLVRAVRGGRAPLRLASGLVLHGADGAYTAVTETILRGAPLDL
ncbi:methyltransferase [Thalassobaculum sp. OXR-137]|uniref:tRNA1(Val) (adenine(37)-N6)-methyltransferase n=1 Tax=Thalassobaculum sp. OXR-137 TaxID=3100173 RepID=UPI002AC903EE|nr:methyltransferase [Thalassobaculum sp. OXR-137]WPZ36609.1 methyltransferase [Thalassobaculum sp. OXR-137]